MNMSEVEPQRFASCSMVKDTFPSRAEIVRRLTYGRFGEAPKAAREIDLGRFRLFEGRPERPQDQPLQAGSAA